MREWIVHIILVAGISATLSTSLLLLWDGLLRDAINRAPFLLLSPLAVGITVALANAIYEARK